MQFPTGVSQRTWSATASEPITSGLLRANVTAPLWMITSPPMAILAQQLSAQSMPSGTRTTVQPLDTEYLDTGGGHSDAVNTFRFYVPASGWWLVRGAVPYAAATSNNNSSFGAGIQLIPAGSSPVNYDGARHSGPPSTTAVPMPAFTELLPCNASGDELQMYGFQDTGGSVVLVAGATVGVFPWLAARWAGVLGGTAALPVPSPASFNDATEITGAFMNANVRDTVNFLAFPPMARLANAGASQSIPSGTDTAVTWNTATINPTGSSPVNSDNYGGWSSGTNPSRYTFKRAGRYYCWGQVAFAASNAGQWQCGLRVNGSTTWYGTRTSAAGTSSAGMIITAERYLRVSSGDYVEVTGSQSTGSGVSLATTAPAYSKLIVLWRGA